MHETLKGSDNMAAKIHLATPLSWKQSEQLPQAESLQCLCSIQNGIVLISLAYIE